jgi:hypothetical protein
MIRRRGAALVVSEVESMLRPPGSQASRVNFGTQYQQDVQKLPQRRGVQPGLR